MKERRRMTFRENVSIFLICAVVTFPAFYIASFFPPKAVCPCCDCREAYPLQFEKEDDCCKEDGCCKNRIETRRKVLENLGI